jgi:hypothetical protein
MNGWGKVQYSRALDPGLRKAGLAARGLDEAMILWSGLQGTDGRVTMDDVEMVAMVHGHPQGVDELVDSLVAVGRWIPDDSAFLLDGWQDDHQSASKRAEVAQARAKAGAKGGAAAQARARALRGLEAKAPPRTNRPATAPPNGQASALASAQANIEQIREEKNYLLTSTSDSHRTPLPEVDTTSGIPLVGRGLDEVLAGLDTDDPH